MALSPLRSAGAVARRQSLARLGEGEATTLQPGSVDPSITGGGEGAATQVLAPSADVLTQGGGEGATTQTLPPSADAAPGTVSPVALPGITASANMLPSESLSVAASAAGLPQSAFFDIGPTYGTSANVPGAEGYSTGLPIYPGLTPEAIVNFRKTIYEKYYDPIAGKIPGVITPDEIARDYSRSHQLAPFNYNSAQIAHQIGILETYLNQPALVAARKGDVVDLRSVPAVANIIAADQARAISHWQSTQQDESFFSMFPAFSLIAPVMLNVLAPGAGSIFGAAMDKATTFYENATGNLADFFSPGTGADTVLNDIDIFDSGADFVGDLPIDDITSVSDYVGDLPLATDVLPEVADYVGDLPLATDMLPEVADYVGDLPLATDALPSVADVLPSAADYVGDLPLADDVLQTASEYVGDLPMDTLMPPAQEMMPPAVAESRAQLQQWGLKETSPGFWEAPSDSIFNGISSSNIKTAFDVLRQFWNSGDANAFRTGLTVLNSQLAAEGRPSVPAQAITQQPPGVIRTQTIVRGSAGPAPRSPALQVADAVQEIPGAVWLGFAAVAALAYARRNRR